VILGSSKCKLISHFGVIARCGYHFLWVVTIILMLATYVSPLWVGCLSFFWISKINLLKVQRAQPKYTKNIQEKTPGKIKNRFMGSLSFNLFIIMIILLACIHFSGVKGSLPLAACKFCRVWHFFGIIHCHLFLS
jgi:hypothetical protein